MRWFGRRDNDYREELEAHIQMEVKENVERGMPLDEARQAALRAFGNALAVREKLGEALPLHFWQTLYRDVRYRAPPARLAESRGYPLAAIFSLVEAVMLRMLSRQAVSHQSTGCGQFAS